MNKTVVHEEVRPIRITKEAFEELVRGSTHPAVAEVRWGVVDDEGFWAPSIYVHGRPEPEPVLMWFIGTLAPLVLAFIAGLLIGWWLS